MRGSELRDDGGAGDLFLVLMIPAGRVVIDDGGSAGMSLPRVPRRVSAAHTILRSDVAVSRFGGVSRVDHTSVPDRRLQRPPACEPGAYYFAALRGITVLGGAPEARSRSPRRAGWSIGDTTRVSRAHRHDSSFGLGGDPRAVASAKSVTARRDPGRAPAAAAWRGDVSRGATLGLRGRGLPALATKSPRTFGG